MRPNDDNPPAGDFRGDALVREFDPADYADPRGYAPVFHPLRFDPKLWQEYGEH